MKKIITSILLLFTIAISINAEEIEEFPLRAKFNNIPVISCQDLYQLLDEFILIDVRSKFEYDTLRIKSAILAPLSNKGFITKIKEIRAKDPRPMVFYCNGTTCAKSYEACREALESGFSNVFAFDLGVLGWTMAHPAAATLLDETPVSLDDLISDEDFMSHMLAPSDFIKIIEDNTFVVDIRDPFQRKVTILRDITRNIPLDRIKLILPKIKTSNENLLIYDAVGKQIRWLQYLLNKEGIQRYFFMEGGIRGYLDAKLPLEPLIKSN